MQLIKSSFRKCGFVVFCLAWLISLSAQAADIQSFSFEVAGDVRQYAGPAPAGKRYFDGACEAIAKAGAGAFMISPGDIDPPQPIHDTIIRYLGTNYGWYPVIGNHEAQKPDDMAWLRNFVQRSIPNVVRRNSARSKDCYYSFDHGTAHFVVIDGYFDGNSKQAGKGDISDSALAWLAQDLAGTKQKLSFVVGHKPIKTLPDMDTKRVRHAGESVSSDDARREQFVQILKKNKVRAYLCGHTHNTSVQKVQGVWQLDSGHARGAGDSGSPSTFLKIRVAGEKAWVDVYRADKRGNVYQLTRTQALD